MCIENGFDAKTVSELLGHASVNITLNRYVHSSIDMWFIENIIENWLDQIQNKISQIVDNGESKETAWLQTFSRCYFIDNIELFLKLIGEEISEETITLLAQGISIIRDLDDNVNELEKSAKKKEQEQVCL